MSQSQLWLVGEFGLYSTCFAPLRLTRQSGRCSFNHRLPVQLRLFWAECIGMPQKPEMQGGSERKMKQNSQLNLESLKTTWISTSYMEQVGKLRKDHQHRSKIIHQWPGASERFLWGVTPPRIGVQLGSSVDPGNKKWTARSEGSKKHATFPYQNYQNRKIHRQTHTRMVSTLYEFVHPAWHELLDEFWSVLI